MVGYVIMGFGKSMNNNWIMGEYIKFIKYKMWKGV